jgi:hypothetical protein
MRPSLQPYLASKSAFTVAASLGSRSLCTTRAIALNSASPTRTLTWGYDWMLRTQLALSRSATR